MKKPQAKACGSTGTNFIVIQPANKFVSLNRRPIQLNQARDLRESQKHDWGVLLFQDSVTDDSVHLWA